MGKVTIIGAGPYGLAAAAHLKATDLDVAAFGQPMSFWSGQMPTGMLLRSPRVASNIGNPRGELDLDGYCAATGSVVGSPVPLASFVDYGCWFASRVVPDLDQRHVEHVEHGDKHGDKHGDGGFTLTLDDGEQVTTSRLIIAAGIAPFAHIPAEFRDLPADLVSHASWHRDLGKFGGQRVLVVGGGQSALESAALLNENGAEVHIAARAPMIRWLGQRPWLRSLGPVSRVLYAPPEVGPPLLSQLVRVPDVVRRLPARPRVALDRRSIRPAGAGWLKSRVDGPVQLSSGRAVRQAVATADGVAVTFDDGVQEVCDHVLLGTGYRVNLEHYPFLPAELLSRIRRVNGYPVLGPGFESSVPGLHFLGAPSAYSFGPLMRFVAGTPFTGVELARSLTASARRPVLGNLVRT